MSGELPKPDKPLDPSDYISAHLARQQGDCPDYAELLEADGKNPLAPATDEAFSLWFADKKKEQEDLRVEFVGDEIDPTITSICVDGSCYDG